MSKSWLIVGGGIHGTHVAARLIGEVGVDPDLVRIIDPEVQLLKRWRRCTATTGMTHLRSPSVHHLDLHPWSLQRFAGKRKTRRRGLFAAPYDRPELELFNTHCDHVVAEFGLAELHVRSRVERCVLESDCVRLSLQDGQELRGENVVLAIGAGDQPLIPGWAIWCSPRVQHVFDPEFVRLPSNNERVVVVGGGISACQVALRLIRSNRRVSIVSRHPLRTYQFDSAPGWQGPKFMAGFTEDRDFDSRRATITKARKLGSVPVGIARRVQRALADGSLQWHETQIKRARPFGDQVRLRTSCGYDLKASHVLLATGFEKQRPGGALVDDMVADNMLPCASCGYPIVDASLRWHDRVYVTGPLAELELGPASRNIVGARRAGDRLVGALLADTPMKQSRIA